MAPASSSSSQDNQWMAQALRLARRGFGMTSPNPMVGAILVKSGKIIGRGWHHRAGAPHAEIEALRDAQSRGHHPRGSTLYVTLEPCSTQARTPPCTAAIMTAGIRAVVIGATDPNPQHAGRAYDLLRRPGIHVTHGVLADQCTRLNESFNHWIIHRRPLVTVKAAMTLDGKIATARGESKWITGEKARAHGMSLRQGADAVVVGINTILQDDPRLTFRSKRPNGATKKQLRRVVLDSFARTPLDSRVVSDQESYLTTVVVSKLAPGQRIAALQKRVNVLVAPSSRIMHSDPRRARINLSWLLKRLGAENVTSVLVEGGGEVNASFLFQRLAQRVAFFYAPKVLGGRLARHAVAGDGATRIEESLDLMEIEWRKLDRDLLLTARVAPSK